MKLTDKQLDVFNYIKESIRERGIPPTIREVAVEMSINPNAASDRLKAVERKGYIEIYPGVSRGIRVK